MHQVIAFIAIGFFIVVFGTVTALLFDPAHRDRVERLNRVEARKQKREDILLRLAKELG